jgi:glycosyltransferase involved in cell wall biosynthesis
MIKKIASYSKQDTGVYFYRIVQPLRFFKRTGLVKECRITPFSGENVMNNGKLEFNDKLLMRMTKGADILWTTIPFSKKEMLKMLNLRKHSGAKWVIDIDDNFFAITKDNPAHDNAQMLKDEIILALTLADGLTVSVPSLKELYEPYNPNIFVMPNGIDPLEYRYPVGKHDKIRIGWRGAYGHTQDMNLVADVLEHIEKDFDVEIVTFGVKPKLKVKNHLHHEWVPFTEYPEVVQKLGYDIAIVPNLRVFCNEDSRGRFPYDQ